MPKQHLSRREFLGSSALAAAPFILPSHIWAAETKPNDKLVLGFIGMGTQNRGLLGGFLGKAETQAVAVCDVDTNRRENGKRLVETHYAKQTGSDYKGCATYGDFREVIARKDIDAVVIATPDHWHAIITIAAANAGKDIYCEKPLCETIHEARAMVTAVRKNNRVFQTGSMQRSSREFRVACELAFNKNIGQIKTVEVSVGGPGRDCTLPAETDEPGLNWDMWLGPAKMRPYHSELSPRGVHKHFPNWRNYWEYGGGMITDWGAHHFDIAQWGMGMDNSGPVEIFPASPGAQQGVRYVYANGTEVIHKNGNGIWFHGTEGKIYVNRGRFELYLGTEKKAESVGQAEPIAAEMLQGAGVTRLYRSDDHKADWLRSIQTRKPPICDVDVGAHTVTVCHLVNMAYRYNAHIKWDPAKNQFAGGTGNAKWLTRDYRAPWKVA